ncbi:glycoside hydrolase family 43 protein [Frateuria aurantia]
MALNPFFFIGTVRAMARQLRCHRRKAGLGRQLACISWLACTMHATVAATEAFPGAPGGEWVDTDGQRINAHGAGMLRIGADLYWFGEYKTAGPEGNAAHVGVSVYRSRDMMHWTYRGIALAVSKDPRSDIADGSIIERPKVIYDAATHRYVMWFHLELKGQAYRAARVGVASSRTVEGPYTFVRSFRPNGQESRDMTLFTDDDGRSYLLYSSENNDSIHLSRLRADDMDVEPGYIRLFAGESLEAPAIFKSGGRYFFLGSHCTGWRPNAAVAAVATSLSGPWHEFGNPARGPGASTTFDSQSAYVLAMPGRPGHFIYMGDRWRPDNAIDGRYVWMPLTVRDGRYHIDGEQL